MSYKIIEGRKVVYIAVRLEVDAYANVQDVISEVDYSFIHDNIKRTEIVEIYKRHPSHVGAVRAEPLGPKKYAGPRHLYDDPIEALNAWSELHAKFKLFAFGHKSEEYGTFYVMAEDADQAFEFVRKYDPERYRSDWWTLHEQFEKGQVVADVE